LPASERTDLLEKKIAKLIFCFTRLRPLGGILGGSRSEDNRAGGLLRLFSSSSGNNNNNNNNNNNGPNKSPTKDVPLDVQVNP
jgi:hypothetical protein